MENRKTILFRLGEETRHVVECIDDDTIEYSLFSDQYKKALSSLNTLIASLHSQKHLKPDNPLNNIISFIGDRGAGKTSCMMSIAEVLRSGLTEEMKKAYPQIASSSFFCLERLDPSFFDETHNVIELFLATLYNSFLEISQVKSGEAGRDPQKDDLAGRVFEGFSSAQKMMSEMIDPESDRTDVLQNLQSLSAGIRLGTVMRELVSDFFAFQGKENGLLVLPIDDIDLNSRQASEMMEQIRKYLIQPNIVILFAVKLDQLSLTKRLKLQKEYEGLLRAEKDKDMLVIDEMVEAYLTKLIPHQTRVYMPDGIAYFNRSVIVQGPKTRIAYASVRQMIPELIFKKTRYLFYNTLDRTSYIVPDNLRELRLLVSLLENMEDYYPEVNLQNEQPAELITRYKESNQYNKLAFRKYLYENWVTNNLNSTMQKSVQEILDVQDTAQINAKVLSCLSQLFSFNGYSGRSRQRFNSPELEQIMDVSNANYNIAVGDVLDVIDYLEDSETDEQHLKFLFLLRSFISMRLYLTYDELTEELVESPKDEGHVLNQGYEVQAPTRLSRLKLSEYDKQVAGYFINTRLSRIIPPGRTLADTRAERPIDFSNLLKLIDETLDPDAGVLSVPKLRLIEFFLLCISRRYDTQDNVSGVEYRKEDSVFYAESLENLTKNAYFDVGALLFNLTRIKACYCRFHRGEEIYRLALDTPNSLLNSVHYASIDEKASDAVARDITHFNETYWLSWCCFRNAEIIRAFKAHMMTNRSYRGSLINIMSQAFKRMGDFSIKSYDRMADGSYYDITFYFLKIIGSVLDAPEIQEDFMRVFVKDDRPSPEKIDLKMIIRGTAMEKNRKETRIKRLYEIYPVIEKYYRDEVNSILGAYGDYMTREEVIRAINRLDDELSNYRTKA